MIYKNNNKAITLVEVIAASLIFAMISASAFMLFEYGYKTSVRGTISGMIQNDLMRINTMIANDIRKAAFIKLAEGNKLLKLYRESDGSNHPTVAYRVNESGKLTRATGNGMVALTPASFKEVVGNYSRIYFTLAPTSTPEYHVDVQFALSASYKDKEVWSDTSKCVYAARSRRENLAPTF